MSSEGMGGGDLCSPFVELLPVSGASISVFGLDGRQSTVCASDETATRLEEMQFDLAEGPHWDVLRSGRPVASADLAAEEHTRWPVFAGAVLQLGVRALFAFPLTLGAVTVGVVDLYRTAPGGLGGVGTATAISLSRRVAGSAVRAAIRSAGDEAPAEQVRAPAMRREVHQAIGMILVQLDTNATEAFARLRAHAFASDRSVPDVARDVVARRIDFSLLPD
jgi:hypothetical protein